MGLDVVLFVFCFFNVFGCIVLGCWYFFSARPVSQARFRVIFWRFFLSLLLVFILCFPLGMCLFDFMCVCVDLFLVVVGVLESVVALCVCL